MHASPHTRTHARRQFKNARKFDIQNILNFNIQDILYNYIVYKID